MKQRFFNLIYLFLMLVFCVSCFSNQANTSFTPRQWTVDELLAYWDYSPSIQDLQTRLIRDKYQYGNEGNDVFYFFDTPTPEIETMSRGYTNCYGWSHYFIDFVKYKHEKGFYLIDSYNLVLLRNNLQWHYIVIFKIGGFYLEQSNLSLTLTMDEQAIYDKWYNAKWHYQSVIERWVKK